MMVYLPEELEAAAMRKAAKAKRLMEVFIFGVC